MPSPISCYTWNRATADRLIAARGNMSKYQLTKQLKAKLGSFGKCEISKFENLEKQTIKVELLQVICEELDTTVEFIIYGKNNE